MTSVDVNFTYRNFLVNSTELVYIQNRRGFESLYQAAFIQATSITNESGIHVHVIDNDKIYRNNMNSVDIFILIKTTIYTYNLCRICTRYSPNMIRTTKYFYTT
jgi:hypothetical protein